MAKIIHRRASRGNNGSHWIGYSDMMASLLLVFVLTLCYSMYLYFSTLETKTAELDEQRAVVAAQQSTLDEQTLRLEAQTAQLTQQQAEDLIGYISDAGDDSDGIWETNIFGKTVEQLVNDGITSKISMIGDECQVKLQETMQKIVNDCNGGMVCIII